VEHGIAHPPQRGAIPFAQLPDHTCDSAHGPPDGAARKLARASRSHKSARGAFRLTATPLGDAPPDAPIADTEQAAALHPALAPGATMR
jgi:hypothetical protein